MKKRRVIAFVGIIAVLLIGSSIAQSQNSSIYGKLYDWTGFSWQQVTPSNASSILGIYPVRLRILSSPSGSSCGSPVYYSEPQYLNGSGNIYYWSGIYPGRWCMQVYDNGI
ncbi:MAG: hypothetical protein KC615_14215, partial [Anaerolineae bacterium]|nr:hypothetical protein [Anaerolineae bacterium]